MLCRAVVPGKQGRRVVDAFERRENILGIVAVEAVEMEIGGVEFGHQLRPFGFVPLVEPPVVGFLKTARRKIARLGQRQHIFGRAGELEHPFADPGFERGFALPGAGLGVGVGGKHWKLLNQKKVQIDIPDFSARDKIQHEAIQVCK